MNNPHVGYDAAGPEFTSGKGLATVVYALQAASVVIGITSLAGVIINYVKLGEVRGTWVESHFRWQIRTFWLMLLFGVILLGLLMLLGMGTAGAAAAGSDVGIAGGAVSLGVVGIVGGLALFAWFVYRVVKGWMRLSRNQPI